MTELHQLRETALAAARAAAQVHRQYLGTVAAEDWSEKGSADFVTHVDREAEARIVDVIRAQFPEHDILAEEAAADGPAAAPRGDWLWVVDPLDGTTNFLHQYPMYCGSVAVLRQGVPWAGAVVCAPMGEEWVAAHGEGAYRNGSRLTVSALDRMERALIGTGFPFKAPHLKERYVQQFSKVMNEVSDIRRAGSAALDLCHVAAGYFDGFWELDLRPWDYAAGTLMVREAGGIVTALDGGEPDWITGGGIIAGNGHVYAMLKQLLENSKT